MRFTLVLAAIFALSCPVIAQRDFDWTVFSMSETSIYGEGAAFDTIRQNVSVRVEKKRNTLSITDMTRAENMPIIYTIEYIGVMYEDEDQDKPYLTYKIKKVGDLDLQGSQIIMANPVTPTIVFTGNNRISILQ